jgi:simple sugar transport system substrate-binding protein
MKLNKFAALFLALTLALSACAQATPSAPASGAAQSPSDKWCSGVTIRFFAGGDEGDSFASIVLRGAKAAEADLGPKVDYLFSGWNTEKMINQLRESIAAKPDGIAFMGHSGDDAVMPLAEEASKAGIDMMYQNVDVPLVRAKYGGGYVGANLTPQGYALGQEAIRQFGFKSGDHALVLGAWGDPGRFLREEGTAKAFEDAGMVVTRLRALPEWSSDPNKGTGEITAAVLKDPDLKIVVFPGGQLLGAVPIYWDAMKKQPGDLIAIGYDTSPQVIDAFKRGYVQLTSDQQPFEQGYLPILSLCMSIKYGMGPMNVDTGAGFVDVKNYETVADLWRIWPTRASGKRTEPPIPTQLGKGKQNPRTYPRIVPKADQG